MFLNGFGLAPPKTYARGIITPLSPRPLVRHCLVANIVAYKGKSPEENGRRPSERTLDTNDHTPKQRSSQFAAFSDGQTAYLGQGIFTCRHSDTALWGEQQNHPLVVRILLGNFVFCCLLYQCSQSVVFVVTFRIHLEFDWSLMQSVKPGEARRGLPTFLTRPWEQKKNTNTIRHCPPRHVLHSRTFSSAPRPMNALLSIVCLKSSLNLAKVELHLDLPQHEKLLILLSVQVCVFWNKIIAFSSIIKEIINSELNLSLMQKIKCIPSTQ